VEVKSTENAQSHHLKGLLAFADEYKARRRILVSCDPRPRLTDHGIEIIPWRVFLADLWSGRIIR